MSWSGFEKGSQGYRCRPASFEARPGADALAWDSTCSQNLAVYLPQLFRRTQGKGAETTLPRVGFVAKACDTALHHRPGEGEAGAAREPHLIGVPCRGMIDERTIEAEIARVNGGGEAGALADDGETVRRDAD